MRVRDLEFQIPIPSLATDATQPDYSIVQRAWWDIINLCYEDDDTPMRLTMELRIMGDSNLIMAPQRGNKHGTASIEVLSVPDAVSDDEWVPFLQKVADLWMGYKDAEGVELNVRPHWAKEWYAFLLLRLVLRGVLIVCTGKASICEASQRGNTLGQLRIKTLFRSLNLCWRILARVRGGGWRISRRGFRMSCGII